jgi:hypothetical protein
MALRQAIERARGAMTRKEFAFKLGESRGRVVQYEFGHEPLRLECAVRWALALGLPRTTFVSAVLQDLVDDADAFESGLRVRVRCEED